MNRCLNERALLALYCKDGSPGAQSHLRLCTDCAEHYDALVNDLALIEMTLEGAPPVPIRRRALPLRPRLLAAAALGTVAAVALGITVLHWPTPPQTTAQRSALPAFAADVSEAVFANTGGDDVAQLAPDTPYMRAALEAEWPCTQDRFLGGECTDQLSALLFEGN